MGYNLLIYGVYWGYNPLTNHLLTSWDIQVVPDSTTFVLKKVYLNSQYKGPDPMASW